MWKLQWQVETIWSLSWCGTWWITATGLTTHTNILHAHMHVIWQTHVLYSHFPWFRDTNHHHHHLQQHCQRSVHQHSVCGTTHYHMCIHQCHEVNALYWAAGKLPSIAQCEGRSLRGLFREIHEWHQITAGLILPTPTPDTVASWSCATDCWNPLYLTSRC